MEKYKEEIEKEAYHNTYYDCNGLEYPYTDFNHGREVGFKEAFNSAIAERIKIEYAISVLEEIYNNNIGQDSLNEIENKITELKKQLNGK